MSAFRLFLSAAKAGDPGAQFNLGYFYHTGTGIKPNRAKALYWYKRSFRAGFGAAAHNIGNLYRLDGNYDRALVWLERAAKLSVGEANLAIARIYIHNKPNPEKAGIIWHRP